MRLNDVRGRFNGAVMHVATQAFDNLTNFDLVKRQHRNHRADLTMNYAYIKIMKHNSPLGARDDSWKLFISHREFFAECDYVMCGVMGSARERFKQ